MTLLAKSDPEVNLVDHTADVVAALDALRSIWPGLPPALRMAAQYHDFGKAASGFQAMLRGGPPWRFRHELLSAAIFAARFDLSNPDLRLAYLALLTHHKNLGSATTVADAFREGQSFYRYSRWSSKWHELDVDELIQCFAGDLTGWTPVWHCDSPANEAAQILSQIRPAFEDLSMVRARGALVAADHLASAGLPTTIPGHAIHEPALISGVTRQLRQRKAEFKGWSKTQAACAVLHEGLVLTAPTGAGKTEAALLWAITNRTGGERILYVLPYQVSINAMAQRLADLFPDAAGNCTLTYSSNVALVHSNMDLAYLQDALNDELPLAQAAAIGRSNRDAARKIYAPIKVTTAYQLLNVFFGRKFFEVGMLELTNALIVFDEIHAYDGHTLGLIEVMLEHLQLLGARVMIMTATLPAQLQYRLASAAGIVAHVKTDAADPLTSEVRRRVERTSNTIDSNVVLAEIHTCLEHGLGVAVVCNTVRKAMRMFTLLASHHPYLLHARFTYGDRAAREQKSEIEAAMQAGRVVIATQVIEVSLDVSFDTMFTEIAPADALLQRFGRVNRHGPACTPAIVHVCCGEDRGTQLIYARELLNLTDSWLRDNAELPLDFLAACRWMEYVYPSGLSSEEGERFNQASTLFRDVVSQVRPMVDPATNEDLELNLFESIQVVPQCFRDDYIKLKETGRHIEAKRLVVNVDMRVWRGASHSAQQQGLRLANRIIVKQKDITIALCAYNRHTGLDLLSVNCDTDDLFF